MSKRTASGLQSLGVRKGDRVAIFLGNRPEVIEVALACSRLGAIFVPLSAQLKTRQLTHIVANCGARVLVTSSALLQQTANMAVTCSELLCVVLADSTPLASSPATELKLFQLEELRASTPYPESPLITENAAAALLYTSGSTGKSKGVILSHGNLTSGAAIVSGYLRNDCHDRILAALPLSFDYGLSQVTTALYCGACAILTNFSLPQALLSEAINEKATALAGVPTMWAHLCAIEWPKDMQLDLRYITNSGGALSQTLLERLRSRLPGTALYCMYGLTEAFRSTFLEPSELDSRPGSIGKAIPTQEVMILREDGTRCSPGEIGELVHRGSLVALGYWNNQDATDQVFKLLPKAIAPELAVWSGDLAKTDADGFIYFMGRADSMIKTSGHRVSPEEIEEAVAEVPGVTTSIAAGLPDNILGQRLVLAVLGASTGDPTLVDQIGKHLRKNLPAFMVPAEIRLFTSIPKLPNGKPDRFGLAASWEIAS
jgi:acyl-CoA ligase (AMP-forming) (exosortase A-associated)